jgi:hypothetical protein
MADSVVSKWWKRIDWYGVGCGGYDGEGSGRGVNVTVGVGVSSGAGVVIKAGQSCRSFISFISGQKTTRSDTQFCSPDDGRKDVQNMLRNN